MKTPAAGRVMKALTACRFETRQLLACALMALALAGCGRAGPPVRRQPSQSPVPETVIQEPEEETEEKLP